MIKYYKMTTQSDKDIINTLDNLESRLAKIEAHLGLDSEQGFFKKEIESQPVESAEAISERMEFHIGENWLNNAIRYHNA